MIDSFSQLKVDDFLESYPEMDMKPHPAGILCFKGNFRFSANYKDLEIITDQYNLIINIDEYYPKVLPEVFEPNHKIKYDDDFHKFRNGSLCLGSRFRLWLKLSKDSTLNYFAKSCLVPYLYGQSYRQKHGVYPFGELAHGLEGELDDIADSLNLEDRDQALKALKLLGMKKNRANKEQCPCGCNRLTGKCDFNNTLRKYRSMMNRKLYRKLFNRHARALNIN